LKKYKCWSVRVETAAGGNPISKSPRAVTFQSTPSCRGRQPNPCPFPEGKGNFNPCPRAEGGQGTQSQRHQPEYFNPRPRAEGGTTGLTRTCGLKHFNPRPRAEGGVVTGRYPCTRWHFNPRPRAEGGGDCVRAADHCGISIHALVQRAAGWSRSITGGRINFNPRPRAEGGCVDCGKMTPLKKFQSTPSCRGRQVRG